jgi:hypothetical protein
MSCGHPREASDTGSDLCRTCRRVRRIVARVEGEQKRYNEDRLTLGDRVMRGLA